MQRTKKKNRHTLFIVFALTVPLLNFIIFWAYVNIDTVLSTFKVPDYYPSSFWYYEQAFKQYILGQNPKFEGAFGHTFIAIAINLIVFPLALLTAYAFYKRVYGENFFRVVFYLPSIIAITTLAMSFRELFLNISVTGTDGTSFSVVGPITSLLRLLGYEGDVSLSMISASPGTFGYKWIWPLIIFFCVFTGLGTNVVLMCGAMMRIPKDVVEAIRIDGCGFFREMWSMTIPMIMPTITTWLILVVTSVFGFSITPMLVAGLTPASASGLAPGVVRVQTIPMIIYVNVAAHGGSANDVLKVMQALGVLFSLIVMPVALLVRYVCEKLTPDISY